MNLKKLLGTVAQVGATAGAALINPALGAAVGTALAGGAAGKAVGDQLEKKTGRELDKAAGPVGAIGLPLLVAPILQQFGLDMAQLCEAVQAVVATICASPTGATGAVSLGAIAAYMLTKNVANTGRRKV